MNYEAPKITIEDRLTIQVYLCFLLEKLGTLMEDQLADIITECECVNYYSYMEALSIAVEKQLIAKQPENGREKCLLLPSGLVMSQEFYRHIPVSIRDKSIEYGKKMLEIAKLERSVICRIEREGENGIYLKVRFLNEVGGPDLMDIKVFAPDMEQARQMRDRFYHRPSDIVTKIMNMFIKDDYLSL